MTRISRVKNANEMQNKRELNGSNESRCTEMSRNYGWQSWDDEQQKKKYPSHTITCTTHATNQRSNEETSSKHSHSNFYGNFCFIYFFFAVGSHSTHLQCKSVMLIFFCWVFGRLLVVWVLPVSGCYPLHIHHHWMLKVRRLCSATTTLLRFFIRFFFVFNGVISYQWHRARWIHDVIFFQLWRNAMDGQHY